MQFPQCQIKSVLRKRWGDGVGGQNVHDDRPETNAPAFARKPRQQSGAIITEQQIFQYLEAVQKKGRAVSSLRKYQKDLTALYEFLPAEKRIGPSTLREWRDALLEHGYGARTINTMITEANCFLRWIGAWEYQLPERVEPKPSACAELTRNEYLRLLTTAREMGKERAYFLVKVFACLGIPNHDLCNMTVERVKTRKGGTGKTPPIPECLREELLSYCQRNGRSNGPIFVTRSGKPLNRSAVNAILQSLAQDAQIAPGKCTPRSLRKLYSAERDQMQEQLSVLLEQSYCQLLESEQHIAGWEERGVHTR